MRKITTEAVEAFMNGKNYKNGNTSVNSLMGYSEYKLHGNLIAFKTPEKLEVSLACWNTPTTRERLNGIPGVSIHTCKGAPILNGQVIENDKFYTI
jgi:hypothetical protein